MRSVCLLTALLFLLSCTLNAQSGYEDYDGKKITVYEYDFKGPEFPEEFFFGDNFRHSFAWAGFVTISAPEGYNQMSLKKYIDWSRDVEIECDMRFVVGDENNRNALSIQNLSFTRDNAGKLTVASDELIFGFAGDEHFIIGRMERDDSRELNQWNAIKDWTRTDLFRNSGFDKFTIRQVDGRVYFFLNKKLIADSAIRLPDGEITISVGKWSNIEVDHLRVSYLSEGEVLLHETFEGPEYNWMIESQSRMREVTAEPGALRYKTLYTEIPSFVRIPLDLDTDRDFAFKSSLRYLDGPAATGIELIWNWGEGYDRNLVRFSPKGYVWIGTYTGYSDYGDYKASMGWEKPALFDLSRFNTFEIRKEGSKVRYLLNDDLLFEGACNLLPGNQVGFVVPPETSVYIDGIEVIYLD